MYSARSTPFVAHFSSFSRSISRLRLFASSDAFASRSPASSASRVVSSSDATAAETASRFFAFSSNAASRRRAVS